MLKLTCSTTCISPLKKKKLEAVFWKPVVYKCYLSFSIYDIDIDSAIFTKVLNIHYYFDLCFSIQEVSGT